MRRTVRDERIRVHLVHELIDEFVVLFELIGPCRLDAYKRKACRESRQRADQPQPPAVCLGSIHLVRGGVEHQKT